MSKPAEGAEPPSVLQPQNLRQKVKLLIQKILFSKKLLHLQSRWDDHELLFVIGRGNSLEGLEPLEGVLPTLSLVGGHATHLHNNSKLYQW